MRYRVIYFQCLCYLALPLCIVNMHLTRCVSLFPLLFLNFLFLKLQFMRINMYIRLICRCSTAGRSLRRRRSLSIVCEVRRSVAVGGRQPSVTGWMEKIGGLSKVSRPTRHKIGHFEDVFCELCRVIATWTLNTSLAYRCSRRFCEFIVVHNDVNEAWGLWSLQDW